MIINRVINNILTDIKFLLTGVGILFLHYISRGIRKLMKTKINKYSLKCLRCGKEWIPRKEDVRMCPKCKSPYFDTPRIEK